MEEVANGKWWREGIVLDEAERILAHYVILLPPPDARAQLGAE
jgi:hypothetical protein